MGGQVLVEQNQVTEHIYFIENGVAALLAQSAPARTPVQIAMIGREGLVGALALLGADSPTFGKVVMLLPGTALRIPVVTLQRVFATAPVLQAMSLSWVSSLTRQLMHAVASSATDTLMIRCARWLLMTHYRIEGDDLAVKHAVIATGLGTQRAGVTRCLLSLQQAGLIRTARGRIRIVDRIGLERLLEQDDGSTNNSGLNEMSPTAEPLGLHVDPRLPQVHGLYEASR